MGIKGSYQILGGNLMSNESKTRDLSKYQVKILYLSSPFFTPDQIDREERVCNKLRSLGYVVIRPKELGILPKNSTFEERKAIMEMDLAAIDRADAVFSITNDRDMGTFIENGYAIAKKIPVIYFAEGFKGNFNIMLAATGSYASDLEDVTREFIDTSIEYSLRGEIYRVYEGQAE